MRPVAQPTGSCVCCLSRLTSMSLSYRIDGAFMQGFARTNLRVAASCKAIRYRQRTNPTLRLVGLAKSNIAWSKATVAGAGREVACGAHERVRSYPPYRRSDYCLLVVTLSYIHRHPLVANRRLVEVREARPIRTDRCEPSVAPPHNGGAK